MLFLLFRIKDDKLLSSKGDVGTYEQVVHTVAHVGRSQGIYGTSPKKCLFHHLGIEAWKEEGEKRYTYIGTGVVAETSAMAFLLLLSLARQTIQR